MMAAVIWDRAQETLALLSEMHLRNYNVFDCCVNFAVSEAWIDQKAKGNTFHICDMDNIDACANELKKVFPDLQEPKVMAERIFNTRKACLELFGAGSDPEADYLSIERIRHVHSLVMGLPEKGCKFRTEPRSNDTGLEYVPPECIGIRVDELLSFMRVATCRATTFKTRLVLAVLFLERFMYIHPFEEGNGRTGRLLFSVLLRPFCSAVPISLFTRVEGIRTAYVESIRGNPNRAPICFAFYALECISHNLQQIANATYQISPPIPPVNDSSWSPEGSPRPFSKPPGLPPCG